uniref:Uncharacterized protein n=1 Tax=Anguilla anguilla TaxID=7936 RepID=A0A0E9QC85_ANGAN
MSLKKHGIPPECAACCHYIVIQHSNLDM